MNHKSTELEELEMLLSNVRSNIFQDIIEENETEDLKNGLLLKEGVSLNVWNELLEKDHLFKGMLYYEAGNIYIVEYPSEPHGSAIDAIKSCIGPLCRSLDMKSCGATRWVGADDIGREADASYRPFLGTAPLPPGINKEDYVTLIIEVGYTQKFTGARGLQARAQQWLAQYPTVYYILLVSISQQLHSLRAELWERGAANPVQTVNFSHAGAPPITLNVRRLLHIADGTPIPHGHAAVLNIDLDYVRTMVLD